MVAETSFVQTSSGAAAASGARIVWGGCSFAGLRQSSQEIALSRGVTKIGWISDRLQLSTQIQEAGRRMYQLSLQMNFNAGRPSRLVACACLYLVCRRNRSPHLLIDFSDVLQTPVKVLGGVYVKLVRRLLGGDPACLPTLADTAAIEVPIVDPSIFIERFARKLNLGTTQRKVQNTAMRLIQFMHRDWICIGRRPNGLCGAALLIAAYYHGIQCSSAEIAEVVRISETTLLTRLREMQHTPMALMGREEFEKADVDAIADGERTVPPCMKRRKAEQGSAALLDAPDRVAALMPPPTVPPAGRKARTGKSKPVLPILNETSSGGSSSSSSSQGPSRTVAEKYTLSHPTSDDIEDIARVIASQHGIEALLSGKLDDSARPAAAERVKKLEAGEQAKFSSNPLLDPEPLVEGELPVASTDESLSDVDDEELEMYLLNSEESQHKSDMWHEVNKDYLEEWHARSVEAKRKKQAQQAQHAQQAQQAGAAPGTPQSSTADFSGSEAGSGVRRAPSRASKYDSASSCVHSATMALEKKRVRMNRINLDALENLFK